MNTIAENHKRLNKIYDDFTEATEKIKERLDEGQEKLNENKEAA